MRRIVSALVVLTSCILGQAFEVASIHTRTDGSGEVWTIKPFRFDVSGSRFVVENFSLKDLITYAYDIKDYQLLGEPRWADIDRYDINAKADGDAALTRELARPMMQALLADRFQLKVRRGTKEMPVYALVVGKNGPKFKESAPDAESMLRLGSSGKGSVMTVTKGSMAQLAGQFSNKNGVDRPVVDKTGLSGGYDYKLEWGNDGAANADADVVSIFTAIQEQLGLRLEKTTAPIEVLMVDSAAKPSEN
jgi:uncharacterized protein (TIGR03435 family)